jgi:hypothetical protein
VVGACKLLILTALSFLASPVQSWSWRRWLIHRPHTNAGLKGTEKGHGCACLLLSRLLILMPLAAPLIQILRFRLFRTYLALAVGGHWTEMLVLRKFRF